MRWAHIAISLLLAAALPADGATLRYKAAFPEGGALHPRHHVCSRRPGKAISAPHTPFGTNPLPADHTPPRDVFLYGGSCRQSLLLEGLYQSCRQGIGVKCHCHEGNGAWHLQPSRCEGPCARCSRLDRSPQAPEPQESDCSGHGLKNGCGPPQPANPPVPHHESAPYPQRWKLSVHAWLRRKGLLPEPGRVYLHHLRLYEPHRSRKRCLLSCDARRCLLVVQAGVGPPLSSHLRRHAGSVVLSREPICILWPSSRVRALGERAIVPPPSVATALAFDLRLSCASATLCTRPLVQGYNWDEQGPECSGLSLPFPGPAQRTH